MKKSLILTMALSLLMMGSISSSLANTDNDNVPPPPPEKCGCKCHHPNFGQHPPKMTKAEFEKMQKERKKEFEKKLKLTKKQKQQIEANRLAKQEKMEPIKKEIGSKIAKIHQIKTSNISEDEKKAQIEAIKKEIEPLKIKADELRLQNMKEFEAILTDKQRATLEEMKKERRAEFKGCHRPPCGCRPCPINPEKK